MNDGTASKMVPVVLVEDDAGDVEITQRAFEKGRIANPLYIVRDGEEVMEFLQHKGRHTDTARAPRPGLILLDLNMPRLDGRAVLKLVKNDPDLRRIPVVVLTTSSEESDVRSCYDIGANTYVTKPVEFADFLETIIAISRYWLCIARTPDMC